MIARLNPEFDYLDPASMEPLNVAQVVVANDVIHWSGILAARGHIDAVDFPADTVAEELAFVLEKIDQCLRAVGSDKSRVVSLTMFTTKLDELAASLPPIFAPWAAGAAPAVTCIGVSRLAFPQVSLEVQGMALMPEKA